MNPHPIAVRIPLVAAIAAVVLVVAACGGDDSDGSKTTPEGSAATAEPTTTVDAERDEPMSTAPPDGKGDTPTSMFDLESVCTDGAGYEGMAQYDAAAPGPHPIAMFEGADDGSYTPAIRALPEWAVVEEEPFDDNSEIVAAELVGCMTVTAKSDRGMECSFEDTDTMLALFDATYEITVRAAATGEVVDTVTLDATSEGCPFVAYIEEDDTEYVNTLLDDDIVTALTPIVDP